MANKIPWYWNIDRRSITGSLFVVAIVLLLLAAAFLPNLLEDRKLQSYEGQVVGQVITITKNESIKQGHDGTKVYTTFLMEYQYQVNDQVYRQSQTIKSTPNNLRALQKINQLDDKQVWIKYDLSAPDQSLVLLTPLPD